MYLLRLHIEFDFTFALFVYNSILGYKVRKNQNRERVFNFPDSVMALTNRISHNVFRTIAYKKKNGLELIV
jgi:hypothetical protein